jgi:ubiquinone/menaquinone biosynthesis C-methylase UbiE
MSEKWQQWDVDPIPESRYNIKRVKGELSEMESTKQLVKLISEIYQPDMKVLDVGCNVGHYLSGIRRKFPTLDYTGVDAYDYYITAAQQAFSNDPLAKFAVKDIFKPLFPNNKSDIVYCCNVLLHLPDFRKPITNLLDSTKQVCFVRTLLGDYTNIVKSPTEEVYDENGNPLNYWYFNTWKKDYFVNFVEKLGWKTEFIADEFDSTLIQKEFDNIKTDDTDKGTRVVNNFQVIENVLCNWIWAKITPL